MRKINQLIIHCSATRPDWYEGQTGKAQVAEIDRWHKDRGFDQIGYHYYITRTGEVADGRPIEIAGAHAKGNNSHSIGVCIAGGFGSDAEDRASEHYTPAQLDALHSLVRNLQSQYNIPEANIIGHNRVSSKACPGFRVQRWLSGRKVIEAHEAKPERTKATQSKTVKASAATMAASAGSLVSVMSGMDEIAQYIILGTTAVTLLLGLYILRERVRSWADGWH